MPWSVVSSCIDCDVCRQIAPAIFGEVPGSSVVKREPATEVERTAAWKALLACPVGAIHGEGKAPQALFPDEIEGGVYLCGFSSRDSYGANSFFVKRREGNFLVDAPRWAGLLVSRLDALGGVQDILLTHRDDVADAERYQAFFGARVFIHEADRSAAPFATERLEGSDPTVIRSGLLAIPVPGHTRGSVMYLLENKYLFTGDSLYWSREACDLSAFRNYTWHSWAEQTRSLLKLTAHSFEWVLAGHGDRARLPSWEMRARLEGLVRRMEREK